MQASATDPETVDAPKPGHPLSRGTHDRLRRVHGNLADDALIIRPQHFHAVGCVHSWQVFSLSMTLRIS